MATSALIGGQWGDEGKGKVADILAGEMDWVVRFQGGANAGHSLEIDGQSLKLHLLPSGLHRASCKLGLGTGMVIDPFALYDEIQMWYETSGEELSPDRLCIDGRAHLVLPRHLEADDGGGRIDTTRRGIGPAYSEKAKRTNLRMTDLVDNPEKVLIALTHEGGNSNMGKQCIERLAPHVINLSHELRISQTEGRKILLEGAQGALLDIDHGSYPYVTSSSTVTAGAASGSGIDPRSIDEVHGIVKAYCTRVGGGPFPSELHDSNGEHLARVGHEFGTTTGRPRRCGWLDLTALRYANSICGFDVIHLTKVDVLAGLDRIGIVTSHEVNGMDTEIWGNTANALEIAKPNITWLDGFKADELGGSSQIPKAVQDIITMVEETTSARVQTIGTGPGRGEILHL